jgi:hypothetical protein
VIRDLAELASAQDGVTVLYAGIAAGILWGAVVGVMALWISAALRGGE